MLKQRIKNSVKKLLSSSKFITGMARFTKEPVVIVLAYHDICGADDELRSWLRIHQTSFDAQLCRLKEFCNFITPCALFDPAIQCSDRPNLLLTFDDGYAGNYRYALPILEKHRISALFFIATANIESGDLFWFDKLVIPIQAGQIDYLDLRCKGLNEYRFRSADHTEQRWMDVQRLLEDVKSLGNPDSPKVQAVINHFTERYRDLIATHAEAFRPLMPKELTAMAQHPLCHIGSHSHHHWIMTAMEPDKLVDNLQRSKRLLETLTKSTIDHLAFPNGDANLLVRRMLAKSGYSWGYTTTPGLVHAKTDRYQIPRSMIGAFETMDTISFKLGRQIFRHICRLGMNQ